MNNMIPLKALCRASTSSTGDVLIGATRVAIRSTLNQLSSSLISLSPQLSAEKKYKWYWRLVLSIIGSIYILPFAS